MAYIFCVHVHRYVPVAVAQRRACVRPACIQALYHYKGEPLREDTERMRERLRDEHADGVPQRRCHESDGSAERAHVCVEVGMRLCL